MPHAIRSVPRTRGFTTLEVIIVIVIIGVIFGMGGIVIGRAFESYDLARKAADVDWQGRVALERIARELRRIRTLTAADFAFSANEVRFIDVDGDAVCFRLAGASVERSADGPAGACGASGPQPLADNVVASGLGFNFYQEDGSTAASAPEVYYISVALQVSRAGIGETFRVTVQPRQY